MKKKYFAPVVTSAEAGRETLSGVTPSPMMENLFSTLTVVGFGL